MTLSSKLANAQTALIEVRDSKLHGLGVLLVSICQKAALSNAVSIL